MQQLSLLKWDTHLHFIDCNLRHREDKSLPKITLAFVIKLRFDQVFDFFIIPEKESFHSDQVL